MESTERWSCVVGWEGLYEVSSKGLVRRLPGTVRRSDGVTRSVRGRTLKGHVNARGYLSYYLSDATAGRQARVSAHRLVAEAFIGPRPDGMEVLHSDGDKLNNRVENLSWGSRAANIADRLTHEGAAFHEAHPHAKLNASRVQAARRAYWSNEVPSREVASRIGLSAGATWAMLSGRTWQEVPMPSEIGPLAKENAALVHQNQQLAARVARLEAILSVERGDESQAPHGWVRHEQWEDWLWDEVSVRPVEVHDRKSGARRAHVWVAYGPGKKIGPQRNTALECMEAVIAEQEADAARKNSPSNT